jgi:soluble P-type ATPase
MPKRVDANHREITKALEAIGCSVQSMAMIGHGCPDLLVARRNQIAILEIKSGNGQLNPAQVAWRRTWGSVVYVVRTVDEALAVFDVMPGVRAS